ncbi:unnamed protein product [Closterium sp. NIES-54]
MAAQELRWLTYLLTDLGEPPRSPPVLYVDNKAMLALCREQRLEHRTKHIALRYFLARELQQRGQLRLAYVASEANTADIFTKALAPWLPICTHSSIVISSSFYHSHKAAAGFSACLQGAYVARGFSQEQGVDYFQTFSPTPKMTTLRVLLHVVAQRDYELHSVDFSTAFLQGSLHEDIWLRRPPGFTDSFPAGTQWSLWRPVYGLRQAPCKWHDTVRTTHAALGFAPSTADPSLFLRTDTSLPLFYVLVYVDDLVFATADTEALTLVKSELQKRHTCTDLGELHSYLGLQITRDRARHTITLTQSPMMHQVLQLFGFQFSSPQPTPLSTSHSLSAPPLDESVEPSDASGVGDSATQWSSQGYTSSLGSGSVSWGSIRSSSVLSSSCEAEIYAGAMAAQELCWLTYLLTDLGEKPSSPPVLYVDNKAMIALCQEHRLEHRTKHITLRYFLARELQQRGQLHLAYVATMANTADIFTKALSPEAHTRYMRTFGFRADDTIWHQRLDHPSCITLKNCIKAGVFAPDALLRPDGTEVRGATNPRNCTVCPKFVLIHQPLPLLEPGTNRYAKLEKVYSDFLNVGHFGINDELDYERRGGSGRQLKLLAHGATGATGTRATGATGTLATGATGTRATGVTGSVANSERQELRTHRRLEQRAHGNRREIKNARDVIFYERLFLREFREDEQANANRVYANNGHSYASPEDEAAVAILEQDRRGEFTRGNRRDNDNDSPGGGAGAACGGGSGSGRGVAPPVPSEPESDDDDVQEVIPQHRHDSTVSGLQLLRLHTTTSTAPRVIEPKNPCQELTGPHSKEWREAMDAEIKALESRDT